jgi:hypothetical protein
MMLTTLIRPGASPPLSSGVHLNVLNSSYDRVYP